MALLTPTVVQAENSRHMPLDKTMRDIRIWLDGERIAPVQFKTVVGRAGLGFEIRPRARGRAVSEAVRVAACLMGRRKASGASLRDCSAPPGGRLG